MQKGTYTALQRLRPLEADWTEAGDILDREEQQAYARSQAKATQEQERRDDIELGDPLEQVITGIDTLDQGLTLGIEEASTMRHNDFKRAHNDPTYGDSADYKVRTKNLNNYSKNVKSMSDGIAKIGEKVVTMSQNGSLSSWDNELLQTLNGAYVSEAVKFGVNEDGSVKTTVALTDPSLMSPNNPKGYIKDDRGKIQMKEVTGAEIFKGLGMFKITEEVDVEGGAREIGTKLKTSSTKTVNGFTTTTKQTWEEKEPEVRALIKGSLGNENLPSALSKRIWADEMGRKERELTPENMKEIEDWYLAKIKPYYQTKDEDAVAFGARESARGRAEKRNEDNMTPTYVKVTEGSNAGAPMTEDVNGKQANIISFGNGKGITVEETESTRTSYPNIYVTESGAVFADKVEETKATGDAVIYKTDAQGKTTKEVDVVATALMKSKKGWESKTKPKQRLSETEVTNLVKNKSMVKEDGTRFKDNKDFKDYMKKKKEGLPTNQSSTYQGKSGSDYK